MYNQIPYPEAKEGYERLVKRGIAFNRSVIITEEMKGYFYWLQTFASLQTWWDGGKWVGGGGRRGSADAERVHILFIRACL